NACSFRNTINTHSFTSLCLSRPCSSFSFSLCIVFFFNDTLTTEIYTLSLHDALPVSDRSGRSLYAGAGRAGGGPEGRLSGRGFLSFGPGESRGPAFRRVGQEAGRETLGQAVLSVRSRRLAQPLHCPAAGRGRPRCERRAA